MIRGMKGGIPLPWSSVLPAGVSAVMPTVFTAAALLTVGLIFPLDFDVFSTSLCGVTCAGAKRTVRGRVF